MESEESTTSSSRVTRLRSKRLMSADSDTSRPGTPVKAPKLATIAEKKSNSTLTTRLAVTPTKRRSILGPETPDLNSPARRVTRRNSLSITEDSPSAQSLKIVRTSELAVVEEAQTPRSPDLTSETYSQQDRRITRSQSVSPKGIIDQVLPNTPTRAKRPAGPKKYNLEYSMEKIAENKFENESVVADEKANINAVKSEQEEIAGNTENHASAHEMNIEELPEKPKIISCITLKTCPPKKVNDATKSVSFDVSEIEDSSMKKTLQKTPIIIKTKSCLENDNKATDDESFETEDKSDKNLTTMSELKEDKCFENKENLNASPTEGISTPYKLRNLRVVLSSTPMIQEPLQSSDNSDMNKTDQIVLEVLDGEPQNKISSVSPGNADDINMNSSKKPEPDKNKEYVVDIKSFKLKTDEPNTEESNKVAFSLHNAEKERLSRTNPVSGNEEIPERHKFSFSKSWSQSVKREAHENEKIDRIDVMINNKDDKKENVVSSEHKMTVSDDDENEKSIDSDLEEMEAEDSVKEFERLYFEDEAIDAGDEYRSGDSMTVEERREIEENEIPENEISIGSSDTYEENESDSESLENESFVVTDEEVETLLEKRTEFDLGFNPEEEEGICRRIVTFLQSDQSINERSRSSANKSARAEEGDGALTMEVSRMIDDTIREEEIAYASGKENAANLSGNNSVDKYKSPRTSQLKLSEEKMKLTKMVASNDESSSNDEDGDEPPKLSTSQLSQQQKLSLGAQKSPLMKSNARNDAFVTSSSEDEDDVIMASNKSLKFQSLEAQSNEAYESSEDGDSDSNPPKRQCFNLSRPNDLDMMASSSDIEQQPEKIESDAESKSSDGKSELPCKVEVDTITTESVKSPQKAINKTTAQKYEEESSSDDSENQYEYIQDTSGLLQTETDGNVSLEKIQITMAQPESAAKVLHHSFTIDVTKQKSTIEDQIEHMETIGRASINTVTEDAGKIFKTTQPDATVEFDDSITSELKNFTDPSKINGNNDHRRSLHLSILDMKNAKGAENKKIKTLNQSAGQQDSVLSETFLESIKVRQSGLQRGSFMDNPVLASSSDRDSDESTKGQKQQKQKPKEQAKRTDNDDNNNQQHILEKQCDKLLLTNQRKPKSNNNKRNIKLSKYKIDATVSISDDSEDDTEPVEHEFEAQDEKKTKAVAHALKAAAEILLKAPKNKLKVDKKVLGSHNGASANQATPYAVTVDRGLGAAKAIKSDTKITSAKSHSKRLPFEFLESLADLEPLVIKKKKQVSTVKPCKVRTLLSTAGVVVETPLQPNEFANQIEEFQHSTGIVRVQPLTPTKSIERKVSGFRESPILPHSTGFKVRKILEYAGQPPTLSKKNRKRKRGIEEPQYTLPAPVWPQSKQSKQQVQQMHSHHVGATEVCVSSLNKKKTDTMWAINNESDVREKVLPNKDKHRESAKKILQRKERKMAYSRF